MNDSNDNSDDSFSQSPRSRSGSGASRIVRDAIKTANNSPKCSSPLSRGLYVPCVEEDKSTLTLLKELRENPIIVNLEEGLDTAPELVLKNLEVISNIKPGEKYYIYENLLIPDIRSFSTVIRLYMGDNRNVTYLFITNIINNADTYCSNLIRSINFGTRENTEQLKKINQLLTFTIPGLENLEMTYSTDIDITNKIGKLKKKINDRINKNRVYL